jgi:hypothetical protein
MALRPSLRATLNQVNGTTIVGLTLARLLRTPITRGPLGTHIAGGYPLRAPEAACFVIGDVIFCRHSAAWLLSRQQRALLTHELRHTYQYALLGPLFWPFYLASSAWSYLATGDLGAGNAFERRAGLTAGGYRELPSRLRLRVARRAYR